MKSIILPILKVWYYKIMNLFPIFPHTNSYTSYSQFQVFQNLNGTYTIKMINFHISNGSQLNEVNKTDNIEHLYRFNEHALG